MLTDGKALSREMKAAGIGVTVRHADIKDARRIPTLLVRLGADGQPSSVYALSAETRCQTLRDGQHNSFPFVQFRHGILLLGGKNQREQPPRGPSARRKWLLENAENAIIAPLGDWPGRGFLERLGKRRAQLSSLHRHTGASILEAIDRFRLATTTPEAHNAMLRSIADALIREVRESADPRVLEVAERLLVSGDAAMLFDSDGQESVIDAAAVAAVSAALVSSASSDSAGNKILIGDCSLTGARGQLVSGPFPQPNLPQIGQTFLFARNRDIPAHARYRRSAAESFRVGVNVANEIAAALTAITEPRRKAVTWRAIPGEVPGGIDLLIAYADGDLDVPIVSSLAGEIDDVDDVPNMEAAFETRTQRVIDALRARMGSDFETSRLHLIIIRQVDPANRKVIYDRSPTVGELKRAAQEWIAGVAAVPPWLALRVRQQFPEFSKATTALATPRVLAPLAVVAMSRAIFVASERRSTDAPGLLASEVLRLFLSATAGTHGRDDRLVRRVLRLFLARRTHLLDHAAAARSRPHPSRKQREIWLAENGNALRTAALFGVLLRKLDRAETYMNDFAFKLGQFLAAADKVHAGYCVDVRGGALPPSLLGNQVLTMAGTAPERALAALEARWRPYRAWANRPQTGTAKAKFSAWRDSKNDDERWCGWAVKEALDSNRAMESLSTELHERGFTGAPGDVFRAELLLGYLSGPERARRTTAATSATDNHSPIGDE